MPDIAGDIENRPEDLWDFPMYGCFPDRSFEITLAKSLDFDNTVGDR